MQTTLTLNFTAPCDRVAAMLVDPEFAQYVGETLNAENVTVTSIPHGLTAVITVATPENAGKIFGHQMTITETVTWEDPPLDGPRKGRMTMSMSGLPASIAGPISLSPVPGGSTIVYIADFTVRIPLIGRKMEKMAEQYLTQIIQVCEKFGNQWLAEHQ